MADETTTKSSTKKSDTAQQDSNVITDPQAAQDAGYFGVRNPRHPDEAYSLTTGPDAPTGENGPE